MPMRAPTHQPHQRAPRVLFANINSTRGNRHERGYTNAWARAAASYLAQHPLCLECHAHGRIVASAVVDHRTPHRGNERLFWDLQNWQALCRICHNKKTGLEIANRKKMVRS